MSYFYMARIVPAERVGLDLLAYELYALRYRSAMELAWAGSIDDEIAAFSGHSSKAMTQNYAAKARRIMHARLARAKCD